MSVGSRGLGPLTGGSAHPKIRVAQCYTGGVGSEILRRIAARRDMEIVSALVYSEAKEGRDAGELVGITNLGVTATRELDDVIAQRPDVAVWMGQAYEPDKLIRLLEAGINVYSAPECGGYFLEGMPEHEDFEAACLRGNVSFASGGNIPGLVSDALPLFLSGYTGDIKHITAHQRNHVAHYPSATQLSFGLGLGGPLSAATSGQKDIEAQVDAFWEWLIRMSAAMVASGLGLPFDGVRTRSKEKAAARRTETLPGSGLLIEEGSVGGVRWTWEAYSGDRPFLTVINEQTGVYGLGEGWRPDETEPAWSVTIDGAPPITATMTFPPGIPAAAANVELNAARAVNFLPALVDAQPGCRSLLDLPTITSTDARQR